MFSDYSPNQSLPYRRPSSCFSKVKARANKVLGENTRYSTHAVDANWVLQARQANICAECLDTQNHKALSPEERTSIKTFRKPRASFSGFSNAVAELRAFPKRVAFQRRKSLVMTEILPLDEHDYNPHTMSTAATRCLTESSLTESTIWNEGPAQDPQQGAPGWLRRCVSTTFRRRRRTVDTPSRPATAKWRQQDPLYSQLPIIGVAPPSLPDDNSSGAAARAAAAAQNEMLDYYRRLRTEELADRGDAESGVGIDMRHMDAGSAIAHPARELPEELFAHILFYLDAPSLINAELVSQQWHSSASDTLMWKRTFLNDFRPDSLTIPENSTAFQIGGRGLGAEHISQDWKKMWKTRKALHQRWTDGHAAAIYLEGHYDSVYCVQFDEGKILTGSRDRTIRIWDARTYKCIKILGIPARNTPIALQALPESKGRRPFAKRFSQQFRYEPNATKPSIYHVGSILCLQYDDELMITGSSDFTCIMWDIKADWTPIRRVKYHNAGVLDVCFDKKHVVSCSKDTSVCLWDRQTGDLIHRLNGHRGPVNAVQLRGNLAVSASGDGVSKLWNLLSGNCVKEFPSKDRGMACVEFSPDSLTIFAGGNDQVIYQFDASTGELIRELKGHSGLVRSLHLDSANGRIVSGSYDTSVRAYDIRTGDAVVEFTGWTASWILSAKLDYRRIVATSQDSRVLVIDFGFELPGMELLERSTTNGVDLMKDNMEHLRIGA
ncbi:MAG: hypothetical protein Q9218_002942 [Villophora microphyllina]